MLGASYDLGIDANDDADDADPGAGDPSLLIQRSDNPMLMLLVLTVSSIHTI